MFPSRKGYINDKFGLEFYLLVIPWLDFWQMFIIMWMLFLFCKAVLSIKKTSCIISAKSELGRQPLDSFMLYYSRIQLDGINPLVKEAFNINKNILIFPHFIPVLVYFGFKICSVHYHCRLQKATKVCLCSRREKGTLMISCRLLKSFWLNK
jgi:hypothetical protein